MFVIAVDPGGTTGFATAEAATRELIGGFTGQLPALEFCARLDAFLGTVDDPTVLVCERFTISERTLRATKGGSYDAIETIGVLRYFAEQRLKRDLVMQAPADVMNLFTNARLKALTWYRPGQDHTNDALRHLGYYLARHHGLLIPTTAS